MQALRPYQAHAIANVREQWKLRRSICLVAPTGAGKTRMGEELIAPFEHTVWIAHRRELVKQAHDRLRARFGNAVGMIMPGEYENQRARIVVATVQTLLARKKRPCADVLVLDEAHHYVAEEWREMAEAYPRARCVGLTATPERQDGEPLGDIFGTLVVAASYSQLVQDGFLVPVRVHRPKISLGNDLASDPLEAWCKLSEGSNTFIFCARVKIAEKLAKRFRDAGIMAACVDAHTPKTERDDIVDRFRRGKVKVLTNVNTMTEGVDIPEARTVILARKFAHVGAFLQAGGRVLRPSKNKPDAIVIDLTGCSIKHGLPTDDRKYNLRGRAISAPGIVPEPPGERSLFKQSVKDVELEMVARGALPPDAVIKEAKLNPIDEAARRAEFERMLAEMKRHGIRSSMASIKFKEWFGEWPAKEWIE